MLDRSIQPRGDKIARPAPASLDSARLPDRLGWIDRFLPEKFAADDEDRLLRARIFVAIDLFFLLVVLMILLIQKLVMNMPGTDWQLTGILLGSASAGLLSSLLLLRLTGRLEQAATLTVTALYVTLVGALALHGGFTSSPSLAVYLLLPVVAGLFSGRFASLTWSGIVIATWSGFYALHHMGHRFPGALPPATRDANVLLNLIIVCVGIGTIVWIHQGMNQRLRSALAAERMLLAYQAGHDHLTDLPNRRRFVEAVDDALARAARSETRIALLMIDLDHFKPVNDRLGHAAGDAVLRGVAERLRTITRKTDTFARVGGDEFAILLEYVSDRAGVETHLHSILEAVRCPERIQGEDVRVDASIGIALHPGDGDDVEELIRLADSAMYEAKSTGAAFHFFEDTKAESA